MKISWLCVLLVVSAFALLLRAQSGGEICTGTSCRPLELTDFNLTELEALRGRVITLELFRLEDRKTRCFPEPGKPLAEQMAALDKAVKERFSQLNAVAEAALKDRNLPLADYAVNWKEGRIEPRKPL